MDRSTPNFGHEAREFQDNYTLNGGQEDAIIDPLLNDCSPNATVNAGHPIDNQLFINSGMWNPPLNNPVDFYPPAMPDMGHTTLTNSPIQPSDTYSSPETPFNGFVFATSRTSSKSSVPSTKSPDAGADAKPRRSSRITKTQTRQLSTETATKPSRQQRASKAVSVKTDPGEEEDQDEDEDEGLDESAKRDKFLERNRIAASKCRQKKKKQNKELEEHLCRLEIEKELLHKQCNGLVDELSTIKNQLMEHASCNDANINQWLDNEARKFVQRIASQSKAQIPPHQNTGDCCDMHRRSSSVARSIKSEINFDHMPDSMINSKP
ncbi:hypothetical protein FCULG_00012025 [Fusarium culmorum]|uniref:BZIP domain-containing protein n=1 Tax=Fusarium culmorum TaxID=5516 RepID=A0A2T4GFT0_FUSCU|nr:hypothetical protein FCULG_00012025 [Fusarium culmorum]